MTRVRQLLPFPLLGLDTDNGSEFLNNQLLDYCREQEITFTRSRAYKKNDQCFVEQKNGVIVLQLVGYDRFEWQRAYQQLAEVYRAVRLYVNFFQPSMKLLAMKRDGAKVTRKYATAQTPYQRLLASGVSTSSGLERLAAIYSALDPVRLLGQLGTLQDALWKHAWLPGAGLAVETALPGPPVQRVSEATLQPAAAAAPREQRQYRRTGKPRAPRTWRTHPDAFAAVWEEVCQTLRAAPERTAKLVFQDLQARYPGRYTDGQLRTLQRRVKLWRREALLTFDDGWLQEELLVGTVLPNPMRAEIASVAVAEPVLSPVSAAKEQPPMSPSGSFPEGTA